MLLYQQSRYDQAIGELQLRLAEDSEDFLAHGLLALCHNELEKFNEATEHAHRSIHLAPDQSFGHYALAQVMSSRERLPEAQAAIEEAIRLDPYDADYFGMLASIQMRRRSWKEAFEAANQGLEISPEHSTCTNLRAMAQVKLGDRSGAVVTIDQALQRRPDDPYAHANQGWALLEAGEPRKAMEHFREALRIQPEMEWARAGIVAAMKARNFIYRWMLGYFLWMQKLSPRTQWMLVLGGYFGQQMLRGVARSSPAAAPFVQPIIYLYVAFVLMTWLADPLFNLLLRFDRFGRYALDRDQTRGATALAACLLIALTCLIAAITTGIDLWGAAIVAALMSLPVTAIFRCSPGWPRTAMIACTALVGACGAAGAIPLELLPRSIARGIAPLSIAAITLFFIGILASQFIANYLASVTPER